ncbi:MAG: glycosyltransferase [bacterium]|nr:glycosyltransferase [bacterium]
MNISLIIVTKDRPKDIIQCLNSAQIQQKKWHQVIIVDASGNSETQRNVEHFKQTMPIIYTNSDPGITKQRNIGRLLLADDTDVVLFIDDDVELSERTTQQLENFFIAHKEAVGVTGYIAGEEPHSTFKRIIGKISLMYTSKIFGITCGLFNIINSPTELQKVAWLPGAFMAYRWQSVKDINFDEWFTTYGLAEDLDFSLQVKEVGDLYVDPSIKIVHNHSNVDRNWRRFGKMRVINRRYIRKKHYQGKMCYWYGYWHATKAMIFINGIRGIYSKRYRDEFFGNVQGINAIIKE